MSADDITRDTLAQDLGDARDNITLVQGETAVEVVEDLYEDSDDALSREDVDRAFDDEDAAEAVMTDFEPEDVVA